ncbi:MAG: hypothetical protein O2909_13230 [Chloroflexi bacterium]|nr:hypothetical protein [Chloroflexota bacterium]
MVAIFEERRTQPWYRRLMLPSYRFADAARYAKSNPSTVSSWHYRGTPILPGHKKGQALNYLELVEVAFVAFFRNQGVPMNRIRQARDFCAQRLNAERPFTEYAFMTEGMHMLLDFEEVFSSISEEASFSQLISGQPGLADERIIAADMHGQLAWRSLMGNKFAEFEYEYELAIRWHPAGYGSLVVIDPRYSFGAPMVAGLPTWVIKGRYLAEEDLTEITEDFDVSELAVLDALTFEGVSESEIEEWAKVGSLAEYRDSLLG